jgi:two-component system sensor histidine kinase QseC
MPLFTSFSIRRRLIFSVLAVVAATLTTSGLIGYHDARFETEELFDARLAQSARVLLPLLVRQVPDSPDAAAVLYEPWQSATAHSEEEDEATPLGHTYENKLYFQLFDARGRVRLRSPHAPEQARTTIGFGHVRHDGHRWRTFTLHDTRTGNWLIVADRDDVRNEMAEKISRQLLHPFLFALPVLLVLLWWLVNMGTRPLTRLIQAISERHPANLSPLTISQPMQELLPLTSEINRLMRALAETLEHEKQFTNVAAHELRTPLAVLRIHGENALNSADAASREQSLQKMLAAIDRGDRLLRQLLTQARIDNQQAIEQETINLPQLLRETVAELAPLALKKNQDLSLDAPIPLACSGQPILLGLLFNNLVDNAIRYTPNHGEITVRLKHEGHHAIIRVEDNGPGVDPVLLPRLQERFFRVNPQQGDGAGLGLSIVSRIVQLHAGTLLIQNREEGGFVISVTLPALAQSDGFAAQ